MDPNAIRINSRARPQLTQPQFSPTLLRLFLGLLFIEVLVTPSST